VKAYRTLAIANVGKAPKPISPVMRCNATTKRRKFMYNYIMLKDQKPERGKDIEYIDSDGEHGYAYLCNCCGREWRCTITGGGLMIDVVKWRYCV